MENKLTWGQIETNAIEFAHKWKSKIGEEKQEANIFERDFIRIFGEDPENGRHEYRVTNEEGRQLYIDYILPGKILIEMKSKGESLIRAYNQAREYVNLLSPEDRPELLMCSDFEYIEVTNLKTGQRFKKFKITNLKKHIKMFGTIAGYDGKTDFETDVEANTKASYKIAKIYDELKKFGYNEKQLQIYLVRILFLLFAEDTGIFEKD